MQRTTARTWAEVGSARPGVTFAVPTAKYGHERDRDRPSRLRGALPRTPSVRAVLRGAAGARPAHRRRPDRRHRRRRRVRPPLPACGEPPPVAWLAGVARNVVAGHQRSRARELRAVSRLRGRALLDDAAVERIAQRIDAGRASRDLNLSQDALPAGRRAVVELVAVDGLSLAEAAAGSPSRRSPPRPRWAPSCFSPDRGRRPPTRCRRATPGW